MHDQDALFAKPRIQFLYIHHIFKDEEKRLEALLETLSRHHHFASYSASVDMILRGRIDKPYICLSSDDGLKNNTRAADIMDRFGAKACFFICPGIIGEKDPGKLADFQQTIPRKKTSPSDADRKITSSRAARSTARYRLIVARSP